MLNERLIFLIALFCSLGAVNIDESEVKYLEEFGYINNDIHVAALRSDDFYSEKIREFQEMMALPLTGEMDSATKTMMKEPRCGVADKIRPSRARRALSKWPRRHLTYWVGNVPSSHTNLDEIRKEMAKAFKIWEEVTDISFEEKESLDGRDVDIAVTFEPRDHGDNQPFKSNVLAHAFFPLNGDVHFNNDHNFRIVPAFFEEVNLLSVAIHELGHSLGLDHLNKPNSVMFSTNTYSPITLSPEDISAIQAIYGSNKTRRVEEESERPDPCDGHHIDAAVAIGREVYLFKGKWFWTFKGGRLHSPPRLVSTYWPEITRNVDSVLNNDGYQYFFVGDKVYIYTPEHDLWGIRKLTVYGVPPEVKKIQVAFVWKQDNKTIFHMWANDTQYRYDLNAKTKEVLPIHWSLDRATATLVIHGDNYIFTDRGVHKGDMRTLTYEDPMPFNRLFHCDEPQRRRRSVFTRDRKNSVREKSPLRELLRL
ncbi:hypothetical protein QR680_011541 [Steinernema hermaphroditum]|uniref:Peptidase metallopeptidase domain-containing protein n=1 Tax=Steinernema hermaphroditum TaxID=289476 RepID=A0AA39I0L4_9BILA|nr:hypothetical protein QR680_011541 [Steinernema hermaphroditum]